MHKIGFGYDIHPLVAGRKLVLGGLEIPFPRGLSGHSDGDALVHSIADALLGAMGGGDIGRLFPDSDPGTEGVSGLLVLAEVMARLKAGGWRIVNVDAVVAAEEPKISPHVPAMRKILGPALGIKETDLSIKGKTNEGFGPVGEGRAIACWAVALIEKEDPASH
jgi:2-C-methyl-D-erythritol 2,4-cyclodiphosphate synthase